VFLVHIGKEAIFLSIKPHNLGRLRDRQAGEIKRPAQSGQTRQIKRNSYLAANPRSVESAVQRALGARGD